MNRGTFFYTVNEHGDISYNPAETVGAGPLRFGQVLK
jgi:hypothetical protein